MTRLLYVVPWLIARAAVATVEYVRGLRTRRAEVPRWLRWDSTEAEVAEWGDVLRDVDEPPTEEFPVVPASWEDTRESFDRLVKDVRNGDTRALRLRFALEYPTQEFDALMKREFGVAVTEVRPREISGVRRVWDVDSGGWTQATLELDEVTT